MRLVHGRRHYRSYKQHSRKGNKGNKGGYKDGYYESDDYYVVNGEYGLEIHAKDPKNEVFVKGLPTSITNYLLKTNKHLFNSGKNSGDLLSYRDIKGGRRYNTRRNNCKSLQRR